MKKFVCFLILIITLVLTHLTVSATEKTLNKPMLALGGDLTSDQTKTIKQLLNAQSISEQATIHIDSNMQYNYVPDADKNLVLLSSVYVEPAPKGSGVKVEITTPDLITKVSSLTYQNAVITSGATDVLVKIATVRESTGETALAGVYAILEKYGVSITKDVVSASQSELKIIQSITSETGITDEKANKWLRNSKKSVTEKLIQNNHLNDEDLKKIIEQHMTSSHLQFSDTLNKLIFEWMKSYAKTNAAKSKKTLTQIDESFSNNDNNWESILKEVNEKYSKKDILQLTRQDYSDKNKYQPITNALYQYLLTAIKKDKARSVRQIYSHTFIVEKQLDSLSDYDKKAINYIRKICYYYLSWKEDKNLEKKGTNVKSLFLSLLNSYRKLDENPELKEVINRISIATGEAYEAYQYSNIKQKGNTISVKIKNTNHTTAKYNIKTNICSYNIGTTSYKDKAFNFKALYKVSVDNHYKPIVKSLKNFQLKKHTVEEGEELVAYRKILSDYNAKMEDPDYRYPIIAMDSKDDDPFIYYKNGLNNTTIYYTYYDINKDGVKELLLCTKDGSVFDVFTFDGKKAINLFLDIREKAMIPFLYSAWLEIYKDGKLCVYWKTGKQNQYSRTIYTLNNNHLNKKIEYVVNANSKDPKSNSFEIGSPNNPKRYSQEEFSKKFGNLEAKYPISGKTKEGIPKIKISPKQLTQSDIEDNQTTTKTNVSESETSEPHSLTLNENDKQNIADIVNNFCIYPLQYSYALKDVPPYISYDTGNMQSPTIFPFNMRAIVDYYNTYYPETYDTKDALTKLEADLKKPINTVNKSFSDMSKNEIIDEVKTFADQSDPYDAIFVYFEQDHIFVRQSLIGDGAVGVFRPSEESSWSIDGDEIIVPVYTGQEIYANFHFKKNNKNYDGGLQKTAYYVSRIEKNN